MSQQQFNDDNDDTDTYRGNKSISNRNKIMPEESGTGRKWYYGFCGCFLLTIVILFGIFAYSYHRGGVDHSHIDQILAELNDDNTLQLDTKNMVSFSALATRSISDRLIGNKNRISLCYSDLLKSDTDDGKGSLVDNVDQLTVDKKPFYFILRSKLTMEFDVNAMLYMRDVTQYEHTRRYMTVSYLITSSYSHFSTVKLIETGLDTKNKALIQTNEVILCSDNPNLQGTRTCTSNGIQEEGNDGLFIKNTKLLTMSKLVPWGGATRKNNSRPDKPVSIPLSTPNSDSSVARENEQYDIATSDNNINNYKVAEDDTKDVRFYNIIFYRLAPSVSSESSRYNTFKEEPVLVIRQNKCK